MYPIGYKNHNTAFELCQAPFLRVMDRFGEKLRNLRKRRGFTQEQMSELLDVSRPYVAKLERGEKLPNVALVIKLSDIFGVTADQLIRDELEVG